MSAQPTPPPADNTVGIEIDGVAMRAPKGSMIIHAADKAGIAIPRFCYHDKLPIAANCRMCLVDVEKAPKPMPACATPVMEGMKVFTQSKRALDSQRNVMEFLLINHPLDCPICDQGGECELQDVAMGYGRSVSRFSERKRVQADEDMGPLIATDMTRCIHCTRCVRFSTEIAGTYELGGMGRGENLSIGTYIGKTIESELSGNLIDVCPVGALTNKPFRFRARAWELTAKESLGYHDALGSNLFMHVRRGEVLRCVPRDNEAINESWLADRDRYSHAGLQAADRVTQPMLRDGDSWKAVAWDVALEHAAKLLRSVAADQLGVLVHPSTTNEEGSLLAALAAGLGCPNIDHRLQVADFSDDPRAQAFAADLQQVEQADVIALVGCHARWEAPILGHRIRKAWKAGARVHALGSVGFNHNVKLHSDVLRSPAGLIDFLLAVARAVGEGNAQPVPAGLADAIGSAAVQPEAQALAEQLRAAQRGVILLGEQALNHRDGAWLRALANYIAACVGARCNQLWSGANALGLVEQAVLPSALNAAEMLAQPRQGYLLYGIEPNLDLVRAAEAMRVLAHSSKVVAFAAYAGEALKQVAQVILPIGLVPEISGSLTNALGLRQTFAAGAKLPGEARPGWRVLRALGGQLGLAGFDFVDLPIAAARTAPAPREVRRGARGAAEGLQRIATTAIYASDAVVRRSPPLQAHPLNADARVVMHADDAREHGLLAGAMVKVADANGTATLPLSLSADIARGAVWIEAALPATAGLASTGAALTVTKA